MLDEQLGFSMMQFMPKMVTKLTNDKIINDKLNKCSFAKADFPQKPLLLLTFGKKLPSGLLSKAPTLNGSGSK